MGLVEGFVERGFESVREGFARAHDGDEGAAQLCVYRRGRVVVDLSTGADPESTSVLMSVSKGITATCAHILVDRGLLDLTAPVREYWPEFAAEGKADITVAQLLSHQAGLSGFDAETGIGAWELKDWTRCASALAAMTPLWRPGTAFYYHSLTWGYLAGELIRRISGKSVGEFLAAEVAEPLGLSLWIGLPEAEEYRVLPQFTRRHMPDAAEVEAMLTRMGVDVGARLVRATLATVAARDEGLALLNTRDGHAAEIPSGNGIGNARSVARMFAAVIGTVDGIRLLTPAAVDRARQPQTEGLGHPAPLDVMPRGNYFAHGYELTRPAQLLGPGAFGQVGSGGRIGFAHPESGVAVGYTCTNMIGDDTGGPDPRWLPWSQALRETLRG
ncbi:serine hydrolase domain-containing protein [Nocardia pseudobrasiliensis]|uniref:CubicO group peptidase (Beta-lactamase class C family) n=1 Tax=Nocardia pseudobrasiliensis TaxID=45979 RepID=A0A370I236_9NOCA|nr:serine hydrolase domain-containing protein [Nocardia pseudobrasiliensis]RDI63344.1 CubicO group peptidase (beta-lactamase class C family) [Nocardia pseudobrasiliensis]